MKTNTILSNGFTSVKTIKQFLLFLLVLFSIGETFGQFVHPGISHKLSDLDRIKYMIEAGEEPWLSSFQELSSHARAQHDIPINVVNQDPSYVIEFNAASDAWLINDATTAYFNALMWYFTGDSRHAEKAIEVFNTYNTLRRNTPIPLVSGRISRLIEAAEIIKNTYSGWSSGDIQKFKDMLVYPGYSSTTVPTAAIASNDVTFYWKIYNGDPARIGNQGLLATRLMMSMAIFLDNEMMYDRALRHLRGENHRSDDLPYPSGPAIRGAITTDCEWGKTWSLSGFESTIEDFGFNEVIGNYIYENGQSQEASRDQAHALAGVSTVVKLAEIAWNQGDDLYGHLDNRPLLGLEFAIRYNLSYEKSYSDQSSPWEPTIENGEYLHRTTPHLRRELFKINPGVDCDQENWTRGINNLSPIYELPLAHYRDRLQTLPSDDYKWVERGNEHVIAEQGYEGLTSTVAFPMYGSLFYRRVSPGDPINGFDGNGNPIYAMNVLPMTIEAENFDYFAISGEDRVYNDTGSGNSGSIYRTDENVDIQVTSEGGYNIGWTSAGEYLTYTVYVPSTGPYKIEARVASPNGNGQISIDFDNVDITGAISVPNTGGWQTWQTHTLADAVVLTKGVQQLKLHFISGGLNLNNISITRDNLALGQSTDQSSDRPSDGFAENAVDGNTDGAWSSGSVTHTLTETNPWWEVDLGTDQNIGEIVIYGRTDACCADRLSDYTVTVTDSNGTVNFSETVSTVPIPSESVDAEGAIGSVVRIQFNGTNALSLAEVEVYAGNGPTSPVAGKTYYIDHPYWDLRLGANGTQDAYTTSTSTTGANVEWTLTASPTADFFYVDCNGGGSVPRIRTDKSENADMQAISSSGSWTKWEFTDAGNDSFYMTVLDDSSYERMQINDLGEVKMVSETNAGTWESFTFTEVLNVSSSSKSAQKKVYVNDFDSSIVVYPNPVLDELKVINVNSDYNRFTLYNVFGELVRSGEVAKEVTELSIQMTDISAGIYVLNLTGSQTAKSFKIIKQ